MKKLLSLAAMGSVLMTTMSSCGGEVQEIKSGLDPANFKAEFNGDSTALYVLTNANGMEACVTNFGGRLVSLMVPDRDGNLRDVVLGLDSVQAYFPANNLTDFGASVGRYANRINQGQFVLGADTVQLPRNNFGHCLHGGGEMGDLGWQYRVYDADQPNDSTLVLAIDSPDGDNGFPGNVKATVTYTLKNDNSLDITYSATTDKPTIINMTNHAYFNLNGDPVKPITDNELMVNAEYITPVDSTYMTDGTFMSVAGTPFDFNQPMQVGQYIKDFSNEQIKNANGYDHNFVLGTNGDINKVSASLYSPSTGIQLEMFTNEPGVQVYTGNFLDGTVSGKKGIAYNQHAGMCLETQHYPDSPNKPEWPSVVLNPGETYNSHCVYKFSVK
ncbi:MAG: galactose mutarotase [Lachnospiraceae bacterium]|nr:galactose mutarotase [Lachnospiraceae bacterium]